MRATFTYDAIPETEFSPCSLEYVRDFVVGNHYSRTCPKGGLVSHCFSETIDGMLVGAAVFGHKAGNAETGSIFVSPYNSSDDCRELIRLVMCDVMPRNSESRFIGRSLRWLRENTSLRGLLSYADPEHAHSGVIYRASNWLYTGLSHPTKKLIVDGKEIHRRRATNLFKTCSVPAIQDMGHTVEVRSTKPKHRYVYVLQKGMMPFLKYPILKFFLLVLLAASIAFGCVHQGARGATRGAWRKLVRWLRGIRCSAANGV